MSQRLFATGKVPMFLDTITHATEKRRGEDVKIVTLALRVQPFDQELASSLDEGVQADGGIKPLIFTLSKAEPKSIVRRLDVALGCPRQQLMVFASLDTVKESIAFDQVKIAGTYVRTQKDVDGYAFAFKASFGPLGRRELEFIQDWHLSTRFVTFDQAEPSLEFENTADDDDAADMTDADEKAQRSAKPLEWEDDGSGTGKPAACDEPALSIVEREVGSRRKMLSHQSKSKKKPHSRRPRANKGKA
jgi:hypothetical protein